MVKSAAETVSMMGNRDVAWAADGKRRNRIDWLWNFGTLGAAGKFRQRGGLQSKRHAPQHSLEAPLCAFSRELSSCSLCEELGRLERVDVARHGDDGDDPLDAVAVAVLSGKDALLVLDDLALLVEHLLGVVPPVHLQVLGLDFLALLALRFGRGILDGGAVRASLGLVLELRFRRVLRLERLVRLLLVSAVRMPFVRHPLFRSLGRGIRAGNTQGRSELCSCLSVALCSARREGER